MKINRIAIEGFRSFIGRQEVNLNSNLCLIYGQNSHGKTSLGEAIEFLFCGKTARRDVVAVTKTEYADSLRNAFHTGDVYVEAWLSYEEGGTTKEVHIRRLLKEDYPAGNGECISELQKEGAGGAWEAFSFESIGLENWGTPDCLPIIFQHTLRYVSAAKPSDRLNYFRELLDIKDITKLREELKQQSDAYLTSPVSEEQQTLVASADELRTQTGFTKLNDLFNDPPPTRAIRRQTLIETMRGLLKPTDDADAEVLRTANESIIITRFSSNLAESRKEQSNLPSLVLLSLPQTWIAPTKWDETFNPLTEGVTTAHTGYAATNEIIDAQTQSLIPFLQGGVNLGDYSEQFAGGKKCNFCETPGAVTWERIQTIKTLLAKPTAIGGVRTKLQTQLNNILLKVNDVLNAANAQLPKELSEVDLTQVKGYAAKRQDLYDVWSGAFTQLKEKHEPLVTALKDLKQTLEDAKEKVGSGELEALPDLATPLGNLKSKVTDFEAVRTDYVNATTNLTPIINDAIDEESGRQNWSVLKSLWDNRTALHQGLIERCARTRIKQRLSKAMNDITAANAKVLKEDKYPSLSQDIAKWWNMLRPQEPVSFKDVSPKGQGLTSIDLKALLVNDDGTAAGVERNAVAIFSDSQLNCLGLSIFLARTTREKVGLIIFDDPIQSLDREHAEFLAMDVVKSLLEEHGMQVIIMTHDDLFWGDLKTLYATLAPRGITARKFKQDGTVLIDRESQLGEVFRMIEPIHRIPHEQAYDLSANYIRIAAELFCRDLICKCTTVGNRPALPSEYTGEMLGQLIIDVTPHLTLNTSHTTTLQYISRRLNKGSHADYVVYQPGSAALRRIFGELKAMTKDYELPT